MKIFVIPSWYKNEQNPEQCIFIYEQIQGLANLGNEVRVLSPQMRPRPFKSREVTTMKDDCSTIYYKDYWTLWPSKFPWCFVYAFSKCLKTIFQYAIEKEGLPDVIYAHFSYPAGMIASQLANEYKIPIVVIEHNSGLMGDYVKTRHIEAVRKTLLKCNKFICVSNGLRQAIESKLGSNEKICVVSNMINPCFKYYKYSEKSFCFFSMGSLIPRKGFLELIDAFTDVFKEKDVFLNIAGSGALKEELEKRIAENEMGGQIKLLGQLSREETLQNYINCSCFVLASKAETYGLVYREALAVGRPIISTKHGGFSSDDWHDEYGYLIDVDDKEQLKTAMINIYNNFNSYNLENISKLCLEDCSQNVIMEQINRELKSVVRQNENIREYIG